MIGSASPSYRPDIDGLRAIAVGVVIAFHAFPEYLPGGFVGVDVFFVISGFLISGIILNALRSGSFSFRQFYARRIRRIFPALASVLAAVLVLGWFSLFADDYATLGRHVVAGAGFSSNLLLWHESSYFDTAADLKPLLHLWSLGIEEQFYILWPLLLVWSFRWRRGPLVLTLVIAAMSFTGSIWVVRIDSVAAFYAPWNRFWELLAGATLACMPMPDRLRLRPPMATVLATAGLTALTLAVFLINSTRVFPGLWALLPVVGTALLIVAGPDNAVNRVISTRPLVALGLISYPLYLWHWPLLVFSRIAAGGTPPVGFRTLAVIVSILCAWATYRAIEWPIRFGPRVRLAIPGLCAAMFLVATAGIVTHVAGGFENRAFIRSDAGHFVEYYERMRKTGIAAAYRSECDFMEWGTAATRASVDPACTVAGRRRTYFLWGDSFAQALSLGIREALPEGTSLAQVATSGCRAALEHYDEPGAGPRCDVANEFAIASIGRLRPSLVVLAQKLGHAGTDWLRLSDRLHALGAGEVMVVGPAPVWRPTLPLVFAHNYLASPQAYVAQGLEPNVFEVDRQLAAALANTVGLTYVSLVAHLCNQDGCLATVPGGAAVDLMTFDFGHLTPEGSRHIGRAVFKPYLERAAR